MNHDEPVLARRHIRRSKTTIVAFVVLLFAAGYFLGTQQHRIMALIGPVFGVSVYSGELDLTSVQETYRQLKANYVGEIDDQKLIDGANRGLVDAAGDQYTVYMTQEEAGSFDDELNGSIGGGIGAEIGLRDGQPTVVRTLDDTPAQQSGLKAGDRIVSINDESAIDLSVEETVMKIRGEIGTTVKLVVVRDGAEKAFSITREEIVAPSVTATVEDGIGVMRLSRFDQSSPSEARVAAKMFRDARVRGVVLDIRDNSGGYVTSAQDIAGLWLNNQVVVRERQRDNIPIELQSGSNPVLAGLPTVVLVNGSSASASEIVAGALQYYKVAKVMGEPTFGKGTMQNIIDLPRDAKLKVTIARWYTPGDKNISDGGVIPDVNVSITVDDINQGRDPQLDAAKAAL